MSFDISPENKNVCIVCNPTFLVSLTIEILL